MNECDSRSYKLLNYQYVKIQKWLVVAVQSQKPNYINYYIYLSIPQPANMARWLPLAAFVGYTSVFLVPLFSAFTLH